MAKKLELRESNAVKLFLTAKQQRMIKSLFNRVHFRLSDEILKLELPKTSVSSKLQAMYLDELRKQLEQEISLLYKDLEQRLKDNMFEVSEAVVSDMRLWLDEIGFPSEGAFSYVPKDVATLIATGQIYKGKWTLSKDVWRQANKIKKDIEFVISQGILLNLPTYDIAKDIERYIDPNDIKDWDWQRVYPGTSKRVDYNAQRLARTLVQHAYQQSLNLTIKDNPFVEGVVWISAFAHGRTCKLCEERATKDQFGLGAGVFPKNKVPLDHPNGLCSFGARVGNMSDIANRIADWGEGKPDRALDKFNKSLQKRQ